MSALTRGGHHIGLAVSRLEESAAFFVDVLGWRVRRRDPDYPAIFVSDGRLLITLWQTRTVSPAAFDRHANVGLHHLALEVETPAALDRLYQRLVECAVTMEFAPEYLRGGPARHMICHEPSGIRIEFICPAE